MTQKIRIGTRGSRLAMTQTRMVADVLRQQHAGIEIEIVEILTSGDWFPEQGEVRLSEEEGGKGLFAKEIEGAILNGTVDCGVHSMKDMPSYLPEGLVIEHMLPREDPRDAFLAHDPSVFSFYDLPEGAKVGTSSLRRQAFLLSRRPDLTVVPFRGNVSTRIKKLRDGEVDATFLAVSGLKRLQLDTEIASILEPEVMLPAAGQGAVGIEIREDDERIRDLLAFLHCPVTGIRVEAERAALQVLDGSCHTPIGAYALYQDGHMDLSVLVASEDGGQIYGEEVSEPVSCEAEAAALGAAVGQTLKARIPPDLLSG